MIDSYRKLEFEHIDCLICDRDDTDLLSIQDGIFRIVRCKGCGLVYQNPRPTEACLPMLYTNEEYFCNPEVGYDNYVKTFFDYQDLFEKIYKERLKLIRQFKKSGRVLEIGCAHGFHLDFLRRAGWDVEGVELSPPPFKYAKEILHLNVHQGTVEEIPFEEGSYDLILMLDLIEHLPNIPRTLSKIRALLKPDGLILVQVPWELYHWEKRLEAFFLGKEAGKIRPDAVPVHLYFFTPETLIMVLQKNGFKIISRASGNYGKIRGKIQPKVPQAPDAMRAFLVKTYYKSGLRVLLRKIAPLLKFGSGIIIFAGRA